MQEPLIIAGLILGALLLIVSPAVALFKFWMDLGAQKATADGASSMALAARNQVEILRGEMTAFKERVTMEVLPGIIAAHEVRMGQMVDGLRRDMGGMREELRNINSRIDGVMERRREE